MAFPRVIRFAAIPIASVALLVPTRALAQDVTAGAKVGLNVSNVKIDFSTPQTNTTNPTTKNGLIIGGFIGKDFNPKAGLVVEVLWAQAGSVVNVSGTGFTATQDVRVDYVEIPVLGRYNMKAGDSAVLHIFFGPMFAFKTGLSQSLTINGVSQPINSSNEVTLKGNDTGLTLGVQFDIHKFLVDLRYTWGLMNINDQAGSTDDVKTKQFAVMFGIDLAKKK